MPATGLTSSRPATTPATAPWTAQVPVTARRVAKSFPAVATVTTKRGSVGCEYFIHLKPWLPFHRACSIVPAPDGSSYEAMRGGTPSSAFCNCCAKRRSWLFGDVSRSHQVLVYQGIRYPEGFTP